MCVCEALYQEKMERATSARGALVEQSLISPGTEIDVWQKSAHKDVRARTHCPRARACIIPGEAITTIGCESLNWADEGRLRTNSNSHGLRPVACASRMFSFIMLM